MAKQLYTYSLIKALYDKGRNYIDCFWPMVISILPPDQKSLSVLEIQKKMEERFALRVPLHSTEVILTRAEKKNLVVRKNKLVCLTDRGKTELSLLEIERDVERRVNELAGAAAAFINTALEDNISSDDCKRLLVGFIQNNLDYLINFVNPTALESKHSSPQLDEQSRELILLRFFIEIERSDPRLYQTLLDIILGSIMSLVVYGQDTDDTTRKFSKTLVYLDTNIVFSLLSLHFEDFNRPARELFDLMKREGQFELRVFDFTIQEIVNVLKNYGDNRSLYFQNIKVASIYSSLASNGWTNSQVLDLICNIEERLASLEILVTTTGVNLDKFEPRDPKILDVIATYKFHQGKRGRLHDLAAIEYVERLRKQRVRRIKDARIFFLTSDRKLARFTFVENGHRDYGTISEVIPDRLLTNLLWLRNPDTVKNLSIDTIVSVHSRGLFVDKDVWSKFYSTVVDVNKKGLISEMDATVLLYDSNVQSVLLELTPEKAANSIGEQWLVEFVNEAKARLDKQQEEVLQKQKSIFEAALTIKDTGYAKRIEEMVFSFRERVRSKTNKEFKWVARIFKITSLVILALTFRLILYPVVTKWNEIEPWAWLASLVLSLIFWILGGNWNPNLIREKLRDRCHNWLWNRNKSLFGLDELEERLTMHSES